MTDTGITDPAAPTPDAGLAEFDFAQWLSGATETVRSVKLYARADLLAEIDELEAQERVDARIPDEDRGITDVDPGDRLHDLRETFEASAVTIRVRGRSDEWLAGVAKRLKKQGVTDSAEVMLHQIAESVVSPAGVTFEALKVLREKSEAQASMLAQTFTLACTAPPKVSAPFSRESSPTRGGRR